jgi:hypothetical protein
MQIAIIEAVGGRIAELILHPELPTLGGAVRDDAEAGAFARIACAASPEALIAYAEAEASAPLKANIGIVHALVDALVTRGTLSGDEIDIIIAPTISMQSVVEEKQRRADWQRTTESAALFNDLTANYSFSSANVHCESATNIAATSPPAPNTRI